MLLCVIAAMASQVNSQRISPGKCNGNVANAPAINLTEYIAKDFFYDYSILNILELNDKCSRQVISKNSDGTLTSIIFAVLPFFGIDIPRTIPANVVVNSAQNGGTEYIYYVYPIDYVIICTDYVRFAIAYVCYEYNILGFPFKYELSWILKRNRTDDVLALPAVTNCLAQYGISPSIYTKQDQTNCFN